jgi:hypothetical protein
MEKVQFAEVFAKAQAAGEAAFHAAKPVAMAVQNAGGLQDGFDWNKPYSVVSDGVCGFAWVNVYVDGRSKVAKEMKQFGLRSDYMGGYNFWASEVAPSARSSQSMQRKEAACEAFAKVLRDYGYSAYVGSRMD